MHRRRRMPRETQRGELRRLARRPERYRRRMRVTLVLGTLVLVAIGLSSGALAVGRTTTLTPGGIGAMRFGLAKARAVGELSALLGAPAAHGVNTGCSPRYTEVEWG